MSVITRYLSFVFALVVLGTAAFLPVQASYVEPDATDLTVTAGETATKTLTIVNDSDHEERYDFVLEGVTFGATADDLQFSSLESGAASWFRITPSEATVPAKGSVDIEVKVSVPAEIAAQTMTVAIVSEEQGSDSAQGQVTVRNGLATLLFLTIGGEQQPHLTVQAFEAIPTKTAFLPVHFAAILQNDGSGNAQPAGQVVIKNVFGHVVATLPLTTVPRRVPAQTSRIFTVTWGEDGATNNPFLHEWQSHRLGAYTATLEILGANGQNVISAHTRVVLFPWRSVALVVGFVVVICLTLRQYRRRHSR